MPIIQTQIQSDSAIPMNGHFRVAAGPGAGKTHWLVEHIKYVIQHSEKLGRVKKIACITYTNIAVETIVRRLDFQADRVEVSTIHSFLYNNVIKPYAGFIAPEYELNAASLDGHDDHYPSRQKIKDWLKTHPNAASFSHPYTYNQLTRREENMAALKNWMGSINYELNSGTISITADNTKATHSVGSAVTRLAKGACLDRLNIGLLDYKRMFWRSGKLHHEDVLFFSFLLIKEYPFILAVLRAKYPYFFIDEFQDTNPIQAKIIEILGGAEICIGIIGDKAQSIYKFQGAVMENFERFTLPGTTDYIIQDNRRSTQKIIDVLNNVRRDMRQNPIRTTTGARPVIYVGQLSLAFDSVRSICGNEQVATLCWDNMTANAMKRQAGSNLPVQNMVDQLFISDTDTDRRKAVYCCATAMELARQLRFKEAIREMQRLFRHLPDKSERKKMAFLHLSSLLGQYETFRQQPLMSFYQLLKNGIFTELAGFRAGGPATFYNTCTYEHISISINIKDDTSPNRTIHKAKGDEFDNVMLILKEESGLTFLLAPNLAATELHRLYYVAISRAKEKLFITVPTLAAAKETALSGLFDIIRL
jgi:DNA helicase-2/ATP-dependent DNA helicase PcrA